MAKAILASCDRESFRTAFGRAAMACAGLKTPRLQLQSVVVNLANGVGTSTLLGSNGEMAVEVQIPQFRGSSSHSFLMPGQRTDSVVSQIPKSIEQIDFEVSPTNTLMRFGKSSKHQLNSEDFALHPGYDMDVVGPELAITGKNLARGLKRCLIAIDETGGQQHLSGVFLDWTENAIRFTSANGRQSARQVVAGTVPGPWDRVQRIVPARLASILATIFGDSDDPLDLCLDATGTKIVVIGKTIRVGGTLVAGKFPDLDRLFSIADNYPEILIDADDLRSKINIVMSYAPEESRRVGLQFGAGDLMVSVAASQSGIGEEHIPIDYEGESLSIQVPGQQVSQSMGSLSGMSVNIGFAESKPISIRCDGFHYLVMPIVQD